MEQTDEISGRPEAVIAGIRQIASAVLAAPTATPAQSALALEVMEATASIDAGREPREAASIAAIFNAHMDAVLDAANASLGKRDRTTRRAHMARALDTSGLVLLDRGMVAAMYAEVMKVRDAAPAPVPSIVRPVTLPVMPADVASAARFLDDHMEHASPEHALQWSIVRRWMTPGTVQASDNVDINRERTPFDTATALDFEGRN